MNEKLKKCKEDIITEIKAAFFNTQNIPSIIILINNNYESFLIPAGDIVRAKEDINKVRENNSEILVFFYVSMIVIKDEIKVAIAESYNNKNLKVSIFDNNNGVLVLNKRESEIQTKNIVKKEKNKSGFPFLFSNN